MFESQPKEGFTNKKDFNIAHAFILLEKLEQQADGIKNAELPPDVELQLTRLLLLVLERRSEAL